MPESASQNGRVYLNALRLARELRGWSQRKLAEEARLTQPQISRLESGAREPRRSTMRRVAEALDVHPYAIFPPDQGAQLRRALTEYFEDPPPMKKRRKVAKRG